MSLASLRKRAGKSAPKPDFVKTPTKHGYALYNDAIWIGIGNELAGVISYFVFSVTLVAIARPQFVVPPPGRSP